MTGAPKESPSLTVELTAGEIRTLVSLLATDFRRRTVHLRTAVQKRAEIERDLKGLQELHDKLGAARACYNSEATRMQREQKDVLIFLPKHTHAGK